MTSKMVHKIIKKQHSRELVCGSLFSLFVCFSGRSDARSARAGAIETQLLISDLLPKTVLLSTIMGAFVVPKASYSASNSIFKPISKQILPRNRNF